MYQCCLECLAEFQTIEDVIKEHEEAIKELGIREFMNKTTAVKAAGSFCPRCAHDWAFAPNTFKEDAHS
jgi:hypothetical protein